jgi:hypothetical protein
MAIDTTPSTVATNALQAIPFSSLIGGPLDACIKAQANSAMTSWQFINEVGLYVDPETGEKKAVQVVFSYNNNGQMTTLVVPLLTIVPIPYLAIDEVTIDFMANISASSSSVQEDSSNTDLNVNATAEASIGVGPFSLKISASANYSSKQASKSSQESKYSVEYTMNVGVKGGQADMPQGLGTILNILQSSATSNNADDMIVAIPEKVYFNLNQSPVTSTQVQVTVKDAHGVVAPGVDVTAIVYPSIGVDPLTMRANDNEGTPVQGALPIKASVRSDFNATHPYRLMKKLERNRFLTRAEFKAHKDYEAKGTYEILKAGGSLNEASNTAEDTTAIKTNDKGQANFTFSINENLEPGSYSGRIEFDSTIPAPEGSSAPPQQYTTSINYIIIKPKANTGMSKLSVTPSTHEFTADGQKKEITIKATGYPADTESVEVDVTISQDIDVTASASQVTLSKSGNEFTGKVELTMGTLTATPQTGLVTITDANSQTTQATVTISAPAL